MTRTNLARATAIGALAAGLALTAGLLPATGSVFAQTTTDPVVDPLADPPNPARSGPAAASDTRYRLERTQTGFIRLDQQTGAVSFCREESGGLTCRLAADERQAFEQDLDMLTKRVEALEKKPAEAAPRGLASEAEIEQSLSIMERVMRRFMGLIEEFRDGQEDFPNRT